MCRGPEDLWKWLCKLLGRVNVWMKRGRTVPILLEKDAEKALEVTEQMSGLKGIGAVTHTRSSSKAYMEMIICNWQHATAEPKKDLACS
jgi:hypothetical protein